ncbi:MAG: 4-phosphoerythronate dehydrogenase [Pseudohongiellaceae bacterium]
MKIVADAQLTGISTLFADLGELVLVPAEELAPALLRDADALLVRSVTSVNEALLAESPVRFVGTATSGTDHIDVDYLRRRGIELAAAAGSNANAVVDYCMTALAATLAPADPARCTVGVVGYGHIGSTLAGRLQRLGFGVRVCDPPLAAMGGGQVAFEALAALTECPIISLHVPLTNVGEHATAGLIDAAFIDALPAGALLLNTCRGGVVDEQALLRRLRRGQGQPGGQREGHRERLRYVADVWQGEPEPEPGLVAAAELATPHIAGYSRRAKLEATRQLLQQFCRAFSLPGGHDRLYDEVEAMPLGTVSDPWQVLLEALPLPLLSNRFKEAVAAGRSAAAFATLRQQMLERREFRELGLPAERIDAALAAHGFRGL